MKREIYEVHIAYVNENGFHASDPAVNGRTYPIIVDRKVFTHDVPAP